MQRILEITALAFALSATAAPVAQDYGYGPGPQPYYGPPPPAPAQPYPYVLQPAQPRPGVGNSLGLIAAGLGEAFSGVASLPGGLANSVQNGMHWRPEDGAAKNALPAPAPNGGSNGGAPQAAASGPPAGLAPSGPQ